MAREIAAWRNQLALLAEAGERWGNRRCRHLHDALPCRERYPDELARWCDNCLMKAIIFHHDA